VLIFVRTKIGAADLAEQLQVRGYAAEALHGDMGQAARESVMRRLRTGEIESSSPPTSPRAAWMYRLSAMWSTTTFPGTQKRMCTGLVGPAVPDVGARQSCWSRRANSVCCVKLSATSVSG
jgi:hypothetical protein